MDLRADAVEVTVEGQHLLRRVSLALATGECVAITGANGSGKTTLLNVLAGRQLPTSGQVWAAGARADERDPRFRSRVAAMIGPAPMARDLTIEEQLRLVHLTWGVRPDAARHATGELLGQLGLAALTDRFVHQLSSGQRHLVGLALTLARPCDVLMVDEPEQRLDDMRVGAVVTVLQQRRAAGVSLVFATHHAGMADALAERTVRLADVA